MTRLLRFELGGRAWALRLEQVAGVGRCERLYPVPGAPAVLLGLADWQGSVVAVFDGARLLGVRPQATSACLVLLAPPLRNAALFVSSRVELVRVDQPFPDESGPPRVDGQPVQIVDPVALLRTVDQELRAG